MAEAEAPALNTCEFVYAHCPVTLLSACLISPTPSMSPIAPALLVASKPCPACSKACSCCSCFESSARRALCFTTRPPCSFRATARSCSWLAFSLQNATTYHSSLPAAIMSMHMKMCVAIMGGYCSKCLAFSLQQIRNTFILLAVVKSISLNVWTEGSYCSRRLR